MTDFWIFMTATNLIIPIIMLIFGKKFKHNPPKNINYIYGYRTTMSMKNSETWQFAHRYIGNLYLKIGIILLPLTVLSMFFVLNKSNNFIGLVSIMIVITHLLLLIIPIFFTEKELKNNFNEDGSQK